MSARGAGASARTGRHEDARAEPDKGHPPRHQALWSTLRRPFLWTPGHGCRREAASPHPSGHNQKSQSAVCQPPADLAASQRPLKTAKTSKDLRYE